MNDLGGAGRCKRPDEGRSRLAFAALSFGLLAGSGIWFNAHADDHSNSAVTEPTSINKWFANLHQHHSTWGCCGYHQDCWETDARQNNGHWEAYYRPRASALVDSERGARWIAIPDETVEDREELPNGYNMVAQPVLCAGPWYMSPKTNPVVYCFVPPEEQY